VDPFTRQSGPWTITHRPYGHNAYDRVLGRMTAWAIDVAHETGWRIVEHEGEQTARIYSPDGLLVGVVDPDEDDAHRTPSLAGRSPLLVRALTDWVHEHADEFGEPDIPE